MLRLEWIRTAGAPPEFSSTRTICWMVSGRNGITTSRPGWPHGLVGSQKLSIKNVGLVGVGAVG